MEVEPTRLNCLVKLLNSLSGSALFSDYKPCFNYGYMAMLPPNFQRKIGHVIGSRYIVEKKTDNVFITITEIGAHNGESFILLHIPCSSWNDDFWFLNLTELSL